MNKCILFELFDGYAGWPRTTSDLVSKLLTKFSVTHLGSKLLPK